MEFFKRTTQIDFMRLRTHAAVISIALFILSVIGLGLKGLHFGLDFTGGTQMQLHFQQPADLVTVRNTLQQQGLQEAVVQSFGTANDVLISLPPERNTDTNQVNLSSVQDHLKRQIINIFPSAQLAQIEYIGPQVGEEMATKGLIAVIAALFATMAYIALRFEFRFAISAAIALIHDPILILGLFAWFQWEFDLNVLAAVLAVIGYSLNDTIVVYDRVRENFRKTRKTDVVEVVNSSINQTLSRTIMTSVATLMVVVALFVFGGQVIRGFSTALIIGIVIGTYSSIYVAGALAVKLGLKREDLLPRARVAKDDMP